MNRIFSLKVEHDGPKFNIIPETTQSDVAFENSVKASNQIETVLDLLVLNHGHDYAWADGSLYKFVEFDGEPDVLQNTIEKAIPEDSIVKKVAVSELLPHSKEGVRHWYDKAVHRLNVNKLRRRSIWKQTDPVLEMKCIIGSIEGYASNFKDGIYTTKEKQEEASQRIMNMCRMLQELAQMVPPSEWPKE